MDPVSQGAGEQAALGSVAGLQLSDVLSAPLTDVSGSPAPAEASAARPRLALIEVLDRDGRVRSVYAVHQWPVRIGRAMDCEFVLDDPHVAPVHATLNAGIGGGPELLVGDTLNGIEVVSEEAFTGVRRRRRSLRAQPRPRLAPGQTWSVPATGAQLLLGDVLVRLRLPGETLAPEVLVQPRRKVSVTVACGLLVWGASLAEHAVSIDPGGKWLDWLAPVLMAPVVIVAWCSAWALVTKLFAHRFDFWTHLALTLRVLVAITVVDWAVQPIAFALSWTWLFKLKPEINVLLGAALVWRQALIALPTRRAAVSVVGGVALVTVMGLGGIQTLQHQDRWFKTLYLSWMGPPALRLAPAVPADTFINETKALRAPLEKRVADAAKDLTDDDDGGDDE